jgi:hypothetical protein
MRAVGTWGHRRGLQHRALGTPLVAPMSMALSGEPVVLYQRQALLVQQVPTIPALAQDGLVPAGF